MVDIMKVDDILELYNLSHRIVMNYHEYYEKEVTMNNTTYYIIIRRNSSFEFIDKKTHEMSYIFKMLDKNVYDDVMALEYDILHIWNIPEDKNNRVRLQYHNDIYDYYKQYDPLYIEINIPEKLIPLYNIKKMLSQDECFRIKVKLSHINTILSIVKGLLYEG